MKYTHHTNIPHLQKARIPAYTYYLLLWSTTAVPSLSPGSSTVAIAPPLGFLSMTRRHRTKSVHVNSSTGILVFKAKSMLVQQYSFLDIQIMTNERNLQLAASLSILFLADITQSIPNVDDGRQAGRLSLRLGYASGKQVFLLTQIRLVLLFLSVHTKKYTTLKRKQYRTWPTQMFADIHNVSRLKHQRYKQQ